MDVYPGPEFWTSVGTRTGALTAVRPVTRGHSSDVASVVEAEKGRFFVKAVPNRLGGRRDSILRERAIAPFVESLSPALLWSIEEESWVILGFEAVEGREPDFTLGTVDREVIVGAVDRIGRLPLPAVAQCWPETRWDRFTENAVLFRGDTLLHTDINPSNLVIGDRETWVVDWAWPTRGAGFIDPACLVVQLVAADHTPEAAEEWASGCRGWAEAEPRDVDAFAVATVRMYHAFAARKPDEPWIAAMESAARAWAGHRGATP